VHGGGAAAACVTVNVWPATVNVPVLAAPLFDAMLNATDPLPLPEAPLVIVIHDAFDVALHAQPDAVVTAVDPLPPVASTL
jgi:hypothetical protein